MSFEQDPWDREDEEIRKEFEQKDAEIERLKDEHQEETRQLEADECRDG